MAGMSDEPYIRTAVISDDGLYRYRLERVWDDARPALPFVMLNPSTADALVDDPTIRRCVGFAPRENAGGCLAEHGQLFRTTRNQPGRRRSENPVRNQPSGKGHEGHDGN